MAMLPGKRSVAHPWLDCQVNGSSYNQLNSTTWVSKILPPICPYPRMRTYSKLEWFRMASHLTLSRESIADGARTLKPENANKDSRKEEKAKRN